jgi:hypothetical protein
MLCCVSTAICLLYISTVKYKLNAAKERKKRKKRMKKERNAATNLKKSKKYL